MIYKFISGKAESKMNFQPARARAAESGASTFIRYDNTVGAKVFKLFNFLFIL